MQFVRTFFLIIIASAFLTGCFNLDQLDKAVLDKNKELSEQAQNQVGEQVEQGKEKIKAYTKQQLQKIATNLTNDAKSRIEAWLVDNSLNQFLYLLSIIKIDYNLSRIRLIIKTIWIHFYQIKY